MWGCGAQRAESVPRLICTGSGRRADLEPQRQDWKPLPTAPRSRKDTGSARGRGFGSPAQRPRGARRDGALPWRRERAAPPRPAPRAASALRGSRPLPASPARRPGLVRPDAAEEAPARPRWWAPREGSGGEGRKRGRLPSRRPLSRLRRGEEMAPEAIIELPVCLA